MAASSRRVARLLLVALVALAALGAPAAAQTRTISTADEMAAFMFGHLNQFWFMTFFGSDTVDYDLMLEYHFYENGTDWLAVHRCPIRLPDDNAVYCHPEQAIFMDRDLMNMAVADYGLEAVALTMAHEWGHHIQYTLFPQAYIASFGDAELSLTFELMADCFAGAQIAPLVSNRTFDADAMANIRGWVAFGGDDQVTGVPGAVLGHGTSAMRLSAFDLGLRSGAASCVE